MKVRKKYYAVIGINAVAIFDDWELVTINHYHFSSIHYKSFKNLNDAINYINQECGCNINRFILNTIYCTQDSNEYTGVYGSNAIGIFTLSDRIEDISKFIRNLHFRAFDSREAAEEYAIDGFNQYQDAVHQFYGSIKRLNWVYYHNDILK